MLLFPIHKNLLTYPFDQVDSAGFFLLIRHENLNYSFFGGGIGMSVAIYL